VPLGRPLFVSVSGRDILPVRQLVKVDDAGTRVVIDVSLTDEMKKRWKADMFEITEALKASVRRDKLTDATADLIRGKAKFWENSGFHFSQNVSRKISHEEKAEVVESREPSTSTEDLQSTENSAK